MILLSVFIIGYVLITFENSIKINKAAVALLTGVISWICYAFSASDFQTTEKLMAHLGDISGILFFLTGAMTIVELIDAHDGFQIISKAIKTTDKRKLLWLTGFFTFFLSAILDNLTTCIVMVSIMRTLISDKNERWLFLGIVIIAANAGGAWSPIGDVTTTMLWIGGQITSKNIMLKLFIPGLICLLVPLIVVSLRMKGNIIAPEKNTAEIKTSYRSRNIIFFSGIGILVLVPVFKAITHLPPFMGMLGGLGILWIISEFVHRDKDTEDKDNLSVVYALRKIDVPSILFFLGILLAIASLESSGLLKSFAHSLDEHIGNTNIIGIIFGLSSAVIDNVPLVAASMGMYDLSLYPTDNTFWELLAYATGTGGSILIIGSAAGIAVMGMEHITFSWYLKKIAWLALIGYLAGAGVYIMVFA